MSALTIRVGPGRKATSPGGPTSTRLWSGSGAKDRDHAIIPLMPAKRCRGLLFAIIVYVTLDLSLPAMPGAFVFEPADSAEEPDSK
jgi:hypothetical protein